MKRNKNKNKNNKNKKEEKNNNISKWWDKIKENVNNKSLINGR